jgi:hypothetical protein
MAASSNEVEVELLGNACPSSDTDPTGCLQKVVKLFTEREAGLGVLGHLTPRIVSRRCHALGFNDGSRKIETTYKNNVSAIRELIGGRMPAPGHEGNERMKV